MTTASRPFPTPNSQHLPPRPKSKPSHPLPPTSRPNIPLNPRPLRLLGPGLPGPTPPLPKPVILGEAKDPATIPPHRPPTRPASPPPLTKPHTPSTQSRPRRQLHHARSGRQTAPPTP